MLIFLLELEIFGVAVQKIYQNSKKVARNGDFHRGDDFDVILAIFFSYRYGANGT